MKKFSLPPLTAVIHLEDLSDGSPIYVAHCPELDVTSQGETVDEARAMLLEAVELLLEVADESEIQDRLARGSQVMPLDLAA